MNFFNSMRGRLFVLLLLGISGSVAVTLLLAQKQEGEILLNAHTQHVTDNVATLVEALEATAPETRNEILRTMHPAGVRGHWGEDPAMTSSYPVDPLLQAALQERLGARRAPYVGIPGSVPCRRRESEKSPQYPHEPQCQLILIKLNDGSPLQLFLRTPPGVLPPPLPVWWVLLLFFSLIALLAFFAARIATRPLQQLAEAADKLDLAAEDAALEERGSSEVRSSIRAFNRMRRRIRDDLRERTGMLAAITHDLQTPLTRLRLRLEKVADTALRDKLVADMNATQQMLQEGLEFARSLDNSEGMQMLDLDSLLDSLCSDANDSGQDVRYVTRCQAQVQAHPLALSRAFANLLDNAVKYGQRAEVSMQRTTAECRIAIRDFGPGIPAEELDKVFIPFYRLEQSRSRQTGGSGLGLAIARNILRQHGGSITLKNHAQGGLEATVTLPIQTAAQAS